MLQRSWIVAAGGLAALFVPAVRGHLFVVDSRQYYNSGANQDESYPNYERWAGAYNAGGQADVQERALRLTDPAILAEYGDGYYPLRWVYDKGEMAPNGNYLEPQGISVRHGVCGDPRSGDQGGKDGDNVYSTPNKDWPILQEFTQGQVMEIRTVMGAYHWGHLEFFICDTADLEDPDGVVTQECFNKYPLTRAPEDGVNSPIDPNHPGRYYVDPPCRENETEQYEDEQYWRAGGGYVMTMNYQLPADLTCERCVLQMWYFTGHKCYHPGYEEFNPSSWGSECAPNKEDWIDLTIDYCGDEKWNLAEEFWACSDISIKADESTSPTTPIAGTTPAPPGEEVEAEYLGCFHDNQNDRVLGDYLHKPDMTTKVCFDYCTELGAAFMATQWAFECWCSPDGGLDYNRHYETIGDDAVCDMDCAGDKSETCGGFNSFNLYELAPSS